MLILARRPPRLHFYRAVSLPFGIFSVLSPVLSLQRIPNCCLQLGAVNHSAVPCKIMEQLVLFVMLLASLIMPLGIQAQSSVQLINLIGDPVTATCVADTVSRPATVIAPMATESWSFNGDVLSMGWTCHFDWEDSSDCAAGPPCKLHSQDLKVWQGVMGHYNRKQLVGAIALTPCASCVWQIKFDGFYRADQKDLVYAFIAGWNWSQNEWWSLQTLIQALSVYPMHALTFSSAISRKSKLCSDGDRLLCFEESRIWLRI